MEEKIKERINKFMADNKLPDSLRIYLESAAWIGASIAQEIQMEEEREMYAKCV